MTAHPILAAAAARADELTEQAMAAGSSSLERLAALPGPTRVYCTHEYTLSNLRFARAVEPDNAELAARFAEVSAWREQGRISLPSTIALERATNPFLRSSENSVKKVADERKGEQIRSPEGVFAVIRQWKDKF